MFEQNIVNLLTDCMELARIRSLNQLLAQSVTIAVKWCDAEKGSLFLIANDGTLDSRMTLDREGHAVEVSEEELSHEVLNKAISERNAAVVLQKGCKTNQKDRMVLCVPIVDGADLVGVFYLESDPASSDCAEINLELLGILSGYAAIYIRNVMHNTDLEARLSSRTIALSEVKNELYKEVTERRLYEDQLKILSNTDPLTELHNRRNFYRLALSEINRSKRYHHDLSLIIVDIDHFRKVNENFGHSVGDQVIKSFALFCDNLIRENDVLARYGGEEFAVLLPETSLTPARIVAERLCGNVEKVAFVTSAGEISVKASAGVSSWSPNSQVDLDDLIERAEDALARAKQTGRDHVKTWKDVESLQAN